MLAGVMHLPRDRWSLLCQRLRGERRERRLRIELNARLQVRSDVILGQSQLVVEMTVQEQAGSSDRVEIRYLRKFFCNDRNVTRVIQRINRVRVGEKMMLPFDDLRAIDQRERYQFANAALSQIFIRHPLNRVIEKAGHFHYHRCLVGRCERGRAILRLVEAGYAKLRIGNVDRCIRRELRALEPQEEKPDLAKAQARGGLPRLSGNLLTKKLYQHGERQR